MIQIFPIPAFQDNYIWCLHPGDDRHCLVVDPGDAQAVIEALEEKDLILSAILVTHHHWDHTNGIEELVKKYQIPVYGPDKSTVENLTHRLVTGSKITLLEVDFTVLETPGHTLDHICYIAEPDSESPLLFSGDTLFSAGCGRLFEGSPEQMLSSLNAIKKLPAETRIYCTHEYTQSNIRFALAVEPENQALLDYSDQVNQLRSSGTPTLPVSLNRELGINPFLRTETASVQQAVIRKNGQGHYSETDILRVIRQWKDNFQ